MLYGNGARVEKGNGRYGFFNNLGYHYRNLKKWEPMIFWAGILSLIPWTVADMAGNYVPSLIVRGLEAGWELKILLLRAGAVIAVLMLAQVLNAVLEAYLFSSSAIYREHYALPYIDKRMEVDYEVLEEEGFQTVSSASYQAIFNGRGINDAVSRLPAFLMYMVPTVVYTVYLVEAGWWVPVLSAASAGIQVYLLKLAREKHSEAHPRLAEFARKLAYLTEETMETQAGKDIRIFKMQNWLNRKYRENLDAMNREYYRVHRWYFLKSGIDAALDIIRNGAVYGYLLWLAANGRITLAEFVLYYGFTSSLSENLVQAMRNVLGFGIISNTFSSIREYLDTPERKREEAAPLSEEECRKLKEQPLTIEFKNVSFRYKGAEKEVLSGINLKIAPGENLALIGLNGAGKTTLVKLICGFYMPTEGEILVNGKPVREYDRDQYYELISVLFQDYSILPVSLDENIASEKRDAIDPRRLKRAIETADFAESYGRLSQGGRSMLVREVNEAAVDFSGGEKQRLLFARALYKEAPLLILDEPTAALDPIAENELYSNFSQAAEGKTSIFISHRLSSTRFCNRIVLLENGRIAESGTHEELIRAKGRYHELYEVQSRYYKEEGRKARQKKIMEEA